LMPLAITYINEIAPKRSSNVFTSLFFSLGWVSGSSSAGLIAAWLTPHYGWQSLYYVGGVALVFALAIQLWLPESPR
ncbi:MFS transporter, partial [Paraburkholderia sp. SIMBA_055]